MNLAKVEKHYSTLTVAERARLMIAARIRNDEARLKKLIASAERKEYSIKANDETDICKAWHKAHLALICLNAESRIKELQGTLLCWMLATDRDKNFDAELAEKTLNLGQCHRQTRKVSLLAFMDWIEDYELPIDKDLLSTSGVELCLLDNEDKNELKKHERYSEIYSSFTNI